MACRYTVDTTVLVKEGKLKSVDNQPLSIATLEQVGPSTHIVVPWHAVAYPHRGTWYLTPLLACLCCSTTACSWCCISSIPPGRRSQKTQP